MSFGRFAVLYGFWPFVPRRDPPPRRRDDDEERDELVDYPDDVLEPLRRTSTSIPTR